MAQNHFVFTRDLLRWGTVRAEWANFNLYYVKFFAESPAFDCPVRTGLGRAGKFALSKIKFAPISLERPHRNKSN